MTPATTEECATFESILPELGRRLNQESARDDAQSRDEHVASGISWAFTLFLSAHRRGKRVPARGLVRAAGKMVRDGRILGARENIRDAMSPTDIARGRIARPGSLEADELHELLEDRRSRYGVPDRVALKMDLSSCMSGESRTNRTLVGMLARAHLQTEVARQLRVSPAAVCQRRVQLRARWEGYWPEEDCGERRCV